MTGSPSANPVRAYARLAGLGYLIIIAAGIIAEFGIRSQLIVPGDPTATAGNIAGSLAMFRLSIGADLVMLLCDALVAVALYMLLRSVNRGIALLAVTFRLIHTAVYGANLFNLIIVVLLAGGSGLVMLQSNALVMLFLNMHALGYAVGLVFFGVHCLFLGWLVIKSGFIPRLFGVLLIIASFGYLVDSFAQILLTDYADYQTVLQIVVFVPAVVAELSLSIWLIVRGGSLGATPSA